MEINVHPLQEISISLLKSLYFDKRLAVTKAIHTVLDGYYPSIESILQTLRHYKNESLVSEFISANADLIQKTEEEIKQQKNESQKTKVHDESSEFNDVDWFSDFPPIIDVYKSIKQISLLDIEEALSNELSKVCNENLHIEIASIQKNGVVFRSNVEMKIVVTAKNDNN